MYWLFYFRFTVTLFFVYNFFIYFWLFLSKVFFFPIKISLLLGFFYTVGIFVQYFQYIFLIQCFLLQQNRNFFWPLGVFFFMSVNCFSFILIAFLYSSKFFSTSSGRKLICSSLICWVDLVGLNFLFIVEYHQFYNLEYLFSFSYLQNLFLCYYGVVHFS